MTSAHLQEELMSLSDYLETLAQKHTFDLDAPGKALQIAPVQPHYGPLMICVWQDDEERYAIGRIIFSNSEPAAGFTVWLDPEGNVIRGVNDFRSPVDDLALAEAEMCELIERLYLNSSQAEQVALP